MAPVEVVPYFGTVEKPECHMLYNVTTMATTWNTVACRDTRLLRRQLEAVCGLPRAYTFLNYLRCHDDIGWGLDYATLADWGMEEVPHKRYLNEYFQGHTEGSVSRGELYNADPVTGDARFCATTASMCGIEAAGFEGNAQAMEVAIRKDVMLMPTCSRSPACRSSTAATRSARSTTTPTRTTPRRPTTRATSIAGASTGSSWTAPRSRAPCSNASNRYT